MRAIAVGAAEMHAKDPGGSITEREARAIAARSMGVAADDAATWRRETPGCASIRAPAKRLGAVRAVDWEGAIRVQRSRALVRACSPRTRRPAIIEEVWSQTSRSDDGRVIVPGLFLLYGDHVADLSGVETLAQAMALAASELDGQEARRPGRPRRHPCIERDAERPA